MGVPVTVVDPLLPTVTAPPSSAAAAFDPTADVAAELDRQVSAYVELGIATLLGEDPAEFRARLAPLAEVSTTPTAPPAVEGDDVPFVLVLPGLDLNDVAPAMRRGTRGGVSVIDRDEALTYRPLPDIEVPAVPYLLWGVDTGSELCNVRPEDALVTITGRGRTPLTIDEGVALVVVRPDMLPAEQVLLPAGVTHRHQPARARGVDQRAAGEARLVLGPQPAHVAAVPRPRPTGSCRRRVTRVQHALPKHGPARREVRDGHPGPARGGRSDGPRGTVPRRGDHQRPLHRSTVTPYRGQTMLPLSAENRTAAGVEAGEEVDVDIEHDDAPRTVDVPDDLAAVLSGPARAAFDALSFSRQRAVVDPIEAAKTSRDPRASDREGRRGAGLADRGSTFRHREPRTGHWALGVSPLTTRGEPEDITVLPSSAGP